MKQLHKNSSAWGYLTVYDWFSLFF
uniref:Uncharacterized protein n=1 Tax=Anguilla anguilla TaxID=7936 RepID=A0A0E9THX1_ANGAN